jgi:hypothetical protein
MGWLKRKFINVLMTDYFVMVIEAQRNQKSFRL